MLRVRKQRTADDGSPAWVCSQGHQQLWRVEAAPGGAYHVRFLRKGAELSGTRVLQHLERYVRDDLGGKELQLQDAAHVACGHEEFDLGFRHLLAHGVTWYEARGFDIRNGAASRRLRAAVRSDVEAYKRLSVGAIRDAVRTQVAALEAGQSWTLASERLFTTAAGSRQEEEEPAASRTGVLRVRRRLLDLLSTTAGRDGPQLGPWLLGLSCKDYAFFMRAMYGTRFANRAALSQVGGVHTPSLREFMRANGLRRHAHELTWYKRL